jgi:two-component sensor histidine kinase
MGALIKSAEIAVQARRRPPEGLQDVWSERRCIDELPRLDCVICSHWPCLRHTGGLAIDRSDTNIAVRAPEAPYGSHDPFAARRCRSTLPRSRILPNVFWHFGFLAAVAGYACLKDEEHRRDAVPSANGYLFSALIVIPHALTFPGLIRTAVAVATVVLSALVAEAMRLHAEVLKANVRFRRERDHASLFTLELDHRVKNVLALVSAVAFRTQETSRNMDEFMVAINGRINALAVAHDLSSQRRWQGIPLAELVRRELAPYATVGSTQIDGPGVALSVEAAQALAMVFHELATNAAKYGAISVKSGCVAVRWSLRHHGHEGSPLCIEWKESGGPWVAPPTVSGHGTSVISELIPFELGGKVDHLFRSEGVLCKLEIPADCLIAT